MITVKVSGTRGECARFVEDLSSFPFYRVERVSEYVDRAGCVYIDINEVRWR